MYRFVRCRYLIFNHEAITMIVMGYLGMWEILLGIMIE